MFFFIISFAVIFVNSKNNYLSLFFILLCFILIFSLRDFSVGSDTYSYYEIFYDSPYMFPFDFRIEPLFILINYFIFIIYPNFIFYLFAVSTTFFLLWIDNIERNVSFHKDVVYLSFISIFGFLFFLNIARQAFAMAICVSALFFLLRGRIIFFFILVLIASMIHYSAISFLSVFFIIKFSRYPFLILSSTFLSFYILSSLGIRFFSTLSTRYLGYTNIGGEITGIYLILFICLQYISFYFLYRKYFLYDFYYRSLLSVFSFGVGIFLALKILGVPDEGPVRISFYFLIVNVFLFPYIFKIWNNQNSLVIAKYVFYIFCGFYFFWGINSGAGGIGNYYINNSIKIF